MVPPRKLIYLVSEDWYFLSHRLPMALAAQKAGYEVHVATHVNRQGPDITAKRFILHPIRWRRGSINPIKFIAGIFELRRLYRTVSPAIVHHVALQPSIIGSLAAIRLPLVCVNGVAGLGFIFTSKSAKARAVKFLLKRLFRSMFDRPGHSIIVQNPDDRAAIVALGVAESRTFLIAGSGVDVDILIPLPEPAGAVTAAFVGRLLDEKGIRTLMAAHELLARRGEPLRLLVAGEADPLNPGSIGQAEIDHWKTRPNTFVLGHVADIRDVWAKAHIAVLPSRGEGLPKSLLEAAACGRAIVATDVPGCREIARPGVNGLLVPPDDPQALADALRRLAADRELRRQYAANGRKLVEQEFSSARVGREVVALYDRLGLPKRTRNMAGPDVA